MSDALCVYGSMGVLNTPVSVKTDCTYYVFFLGSFALDRLSVLQATTVGKTNTHAAARVSAWDRIIWRCHEAPKNRTIAMMLSTLALLGHSIPFHWVKPNYQVSHEKMRDSLPGSGGTFDVYTLCLFQSGFNFWTIIKKGKQEDARLYADCDGDVDASSEGTT